MSARRILVAAGFVIGVAALVLQFGLTISSRLGGGDSVIGALVYYFCFYTILTNIMVVLIYLSELVGGEWLGWWRWPATRGMMAAVMVLVMGFYHLLLAPSWSPQGWFKVCDIALHYVTPVLYLLVWVNALGHGRLRLGDLPAMLAPTAAYVVVMLVKGAATGEYPYATFDIGKLGYQQVGINIVAIAAILVAFSLIAIRLDRLLGKAMAKPETT